MFAHSVQRIAHEVEDHLLNLHPVHQHVIHTRIERIAYTDAIVLRAYQGQRARLLHDAR